VFSSKLRCCAAISPYLFLFLLQNIIRRRTCFSSESAECISFRFLRVQSRRSGKHWPCPYSASTNCSNCGEGSGICNPITRAQSRVQTGAFRSRREHRCEDYLTGRATTSSFALAVLLPSLVLSSPIPHQTPLYIPSNCSTAPHLESVCWSWLRIR
jgi:hypothetical protein